MLSLLASDPSAVGAVRREARRVASRIGLDDEALGRLALVCTEASENLVRHGRGGEVLLGTCEADGRPAVELIALDRGPGIGDLEAAFVDGYSEAGTAGCGLGALRRLSDAFDIHSVVGLGTAVLARVASRVPTRPKEPVSRDGSLEVGFVRVARRGERRCGDVPGARVGPNSHALCLIDGLGHGDGAADAAEIAFEAFERGAGTTSAECLALMSAASRDTRGAVASVVTCTPLGEGGTLAFEHAGIGNVGTALHRAGERPVRFATASGTLGRDAEGVRTSRGALSGHDLLIMHSDGLTPPDPFARRDGLSRRYPTLVAAVLYRDGALAEDDCAVLVARATRVGTSRVTTRVTAREEPEGTA